MGDGSPQCGKYCWRKLFCKAFEFKNPPVSLHLRALEIPVDGTPRRIDAYAKLYDFGVISIIFNIPLNNATISELQQLAIALRTEDPFDAHYRTEMENLLGSIRSSMTGVNISSLEEDYTIYHVHSLSSDITAGDFLEAVDPGLLLLHEEGEPLPSQHTVKELLKNMFSYSDHDVTVINWDNALVMEPTISMDIPDLLEFATAQLLELRMYDAILDKELDLIYERIKPGKRPPLLKGKRYQTLAARLMRNVTELTEITEKVDNSLKVTEDVYYARVYSAAVALFRVKNWEANLRRKIDIASRVYDMIARDITNRRVEVLELIIVILIAVEIVLFFFIE